MSATSTCIAGPSKSEQRRAGTFMSEVYGQFVAETCKWRLAPVWPATAAIAAGDPGTTRHPTPSE